MLNLMPILQMPVFQIFTNIKFLYFFIKNDSNIVLTFQNQ